MSNQIHTSSKTDSKNSEAKGFFSIDRTQAELDKVDARIDGLKAEAREKAADAKIRMKGFLEDLDEKRGALRKRVQEWKASGEEAAEDLSANVQAAWRDLSQAMEKASSRLHSS